MRKRSCCGSSNVAEEVGQEPGTIRGAVRKRYGQLAKESAGSCCGPASAGGGASCCESVSYSPQAAYTEEELSSLPEKATAASAGCGNPTALAEIKPGETVLDIGSGGGIDVFLAARKVGPTGKTIGVDMTPEMIDLARENAEKAELPNVEFRLGEIEHLPVADESVDLIVSNCVINLSTDKDAVFGEAYRVLRKGGRMLLSDIMAEGLPDEARRSLVTWAHCVGGAMPLKEYVGKIMEAGFSKVEVLNDAPYSSDFVSDSINASEGAQEILSGDPDLRKSVEKLRISHAEIRAWKK